MDLINIYAIKEIRFPLMRQFESWPKRKNLGIQGI
jgi:hypothetical protein